MEPVAPKAFGVSGAKLQVLQVTRRASRGHALLQRSLAHRFGAKDFENAEPYYCCDSNSLDEVR